MNDESEAYDFEFQYYIEMSEKVLIIRIEIK